MSFKRCYNVEDVRHEAKRRLPAPMFDYIDGGADDEYTLHRNTEAFNKHELMPRYLRDVGKVDLSTRVLGHELDLPFFLAPTGMSRLFHHHKEKGVARAAQKYGTLYSLSTLGTTSLEDVAAHVETPKMFQIYILKDRELTREFVQRCKASGYTSLCLTADMPVAGNRERDLVNGMTMPPRFSLSSLWSFVTHPVWGVNTIFRPDFKLANVAHHVDALGGGSMGLIDYVNSQFDRTVTWKDVDWLAQQWDGAFVIKGLQSPDDAQRARDAGATAIMVSNHGGRQLDGGSAAIDCLYPMREAIGDDLELILDGGIRRGTHILKALALGADACSIGKAYLYGLGAGGQAGVEHVMNILKTELERDLALLGCASIQDVNEACLVSL